MGFADLISNAVGTAGVVGKFEQDRVRGGAVCFLYGAVPYIITGKCRVPSLEPAHTNYGGHGQNASHHGDQSGRRAMKRSPATHHPSVSAALILNASNEKIAANFVPKQDPALPQPIVLQAVSHHLMLYSTFCYCRRRFRKN